MLERFPTPALGAIVIWAALLLVDLPELRRIARFRRTELVIALATAVAVAAVDILYGILIAVGLSALDLLRRVARPPDGVLGYAPGVAGMHDIADYANARQVPGLVVYRYDSPLFFANAHDFTSRALRAVDRAEAPVEWFVLNAEAIVEIDLTAVDALEELREELDRRGVVFAMARVKQDLRDDLARAGLLERVGTDHVFMTLPEAVGGYVRWYIASHGAPPPGVVMPRPSQSPIDPG
jgi:SulP family sulfate permease